MLATCQKFLCHAKQSATDVLSKLADGGTKNVEIVVSLKYLSNFWRTLEMLLVNCETNLVLTLV